MNLLAVWDIGMGPRLLGLVGLLLLLWVVVSWIVLPFIVMRGFKRIARLQKETNDLLAGRR